MNWMEWEESRRTVKDTNKNVLILIFDKIDELEATIEELKDEIKKIKKDMD